MPQEHIQRRTVEEVEDVPVPQIQERIVVEIPHVRVLRRILEQMDVPVRPVTEKMAEAVVHRG